METDISIIMLREFENYGAVGGMAIGLLSVKKRRGLYEIETIIGEADIDGNGQIYYNGETI